MKIKLKTLRMIIKEEKQRTINNLLENQFIPNWESLLYDLSNQWPERTHLPWAEVENITGLSQNDVENIMNGGLFEMSDLAYHMFYDEEGVRLSDPEDV